MIRNLGQVAAIYIGSFAPRNTNLIWLDNTVVPFVFRAYDGSAWSEIATHKWVRAYVDGWLVTLPPRQLADDGDYMLINSNNVNYKITVKDFVKSAVGNPLDFKGVIRVSADFPNPSTLESGDMYVIITSPAGGTVTDPYSGKTFGDSEKIVWDEVTQSWESLGKIDITVDLTTSYSETEVTIHSSAGKETTIQGATDQLAGVMLPGQYSWLQALSNGSIVPGDPSPLTPLTPAHKHNYSDIVNRLVSQQGTGESTIDPMSQKATTDALNLKFDKASVLQVSGAATDKVMSQKAVTDALKTLSDDFNNKLTNYLPLAGGTMKGNIRFPVGNGIACNDVAGTAAYVVLRTLNVNNSTRMYVGTVNFPTYISSTASDLIHDRNGSSYLLWDTYNLPTPASTTDLANYLPLTGGTLTGQVTIKQGVDIKLRLQSTDADNYCIIQAIDSQASQLGVFGYAGDKWAIGYGGTYYEIWDKYNLTDPVTYTTNAYNHATLKNKNGQYFTYIKAGTNGLLPHSQVTLASGGSGSLGTSDQSFNAAYINHLHTNKITFGDAGPYIIGSTSATQFLNAEGSAQKVATGGLYVGTSYASNALSLVPANGIYSQGNIRTSGWLTFEDNEWTNTGWAYKEAKGSIKVLSVINETENRPTTNGSVFQFNSRQGHWCTQIWCDQTNVAGVIGTLRFRTTKSFNSTEWNPWTALVTEFDLGNYLPLTGGILTGSSPRVLGIDFSGENETYIRVLRNGKQQAAIGFMDDLGAYIYNYNSSKYLFIDNDGYARVGTTKGSTRLALITDIPTVSGYLPLSGGTMSGSISFNGDTGHIVVGARETSNFVSAVSFNKGSATNSAYIGYHSTGGSDSSGSLVLVPYPTSVNPWGKTVGLYIAKNELLLDGKAIATTDQIPSIPSISISNSGTGNAVTSITANGHTLNVTKGATYLTSSALSGYATQSWAIGQFASLALYGVTNGYPAIKTRGNEICIGSLKEETSAINVNYRNGTDTISPSTWYWRAGSPTTWANAYWGNLYMNDNLVATQTWSNSQYPLKTGTGASGTWDINISGNASTASAASKLGSTTIGGSAKPIYLSSGTPTACSATVGSATVPVYMNAGTITQCSTTLGVSITGNAATATNATQLGGTAASSYVKANDNISRLTNDSGYTTQEWVNSQNFVKSTSTKKVTDIQPVDALPATQVSGVLYLVFG